MFCARQRASNSSNRFSRTFTSSALRVPCEPFQSGHVGSTQWAESPRSSVALNHVFVSEPTGPLPVSAQT